MATRTHLHTELVADGVKRVERVERDPDQTIMEARVVRTDGGITLIVGPPASCLPSLLTARAIELTPDAATHLAKLLANSVGAVVVPRVDDSEPAPFDEDAYVEAEARKLARGRHLADRIRDRARQLLSESVGGVTQPGDATRQTSPLASP